MCGGMAADGSRAEGTAESVGRVGVSKRAETEGMRAGRASSSRLCKGDVGAGERAVVASASMFGAAVGATAEASPFDGTAAATGVAEEEGAFSCGCCGATASEGASEGAEGTLFCSAAAAEGGPGGQLQLGAGAAGGGSRIPGKEAAP